MANRPPSKSRAPLSLEASLDEENRQVLAALDGRRAASPAMRQAHRTATPPPPIRSMLDVHPSPASTPRHGSIAGIGVGVTSPRQDKDSKLDPADPSTWTSPHTSKPNSPVLLRKEPVTRPSEGSDVDSKGGYVGLPRAEQGRARGFESNYNFDLSSMPSSTKSPTSATRPREDSGGGAMAAALSGDFSNLHVGLPAGHSRRHNSTSATGQHSRSPSGRITSPIVQSPGLLSPASPRKLTTPSGTVVDERAHRRLSNKSSSFSTVTDESEQDGGRVPVDQPPEEEAVVESSDEQHSSDSEGETRGRSRDSKEGSDAEPDTSQAAESDKGLPQLPGKRQSHSQVIKSLLEPSIKVTSPSGERMSQTDTGVHPASNFDARRPSISATSMASNDDDDDNAIAKAKTLALNISPLDTKVPDRHVRMIIRGDWSRIHKEAEAGNKTVRTYLACTDLSQEATYALEWTVGTIMRDGDTLLAIYSIEDENAGSPGDSNKVSEAEKEKLRQEGAQAGKDASDAMDKLTRQATNTDIPHQSKFVPATELQSLTGSVDARKVGKKEMERLKAIDDITQTFLRLVRKTPLQVRCMIEVIHCKSPKHLILGAIDELDPTLTVVGTRGRSSLKGVLLGSFSNYLVTKSSAPVMVARRKLKKPKSNTRINSSKIRLSNNLMASSLTGKRKSLTQARID